MILRRSLWWVALVEMVTSLAGAAEVDLSRLPPPSAGEVNFRTDILPIFQDHCFRCHGPEKPKSGFRLDNRQTALAGGDEGVDIIAGHSADSPLIHYVARLVEDMEMPPPGKGDPLTPPEIALLRAWIDRGVDYAGADQPERAKLSFALTTGAGHTSVSGDRSKFRELSWLNDGWYGGATRFEASGPIDEHTQFSTSGHVLFGQNDSGLRFEIHRDNWGRVAGGFETRRRWFDDSGGSFAGFAPSQFGTGGDPHLDFGKAWFDMFLEHGDWPAIRLGYELQSRDGTEATTTWGNVLPPDRNIYPSFRDVDERTHIFKVDVAKDLAGWHLADNLRVEWYHQHDHDVIATAFNSAKPGPEKFTDVRQTYQHTQGGNTITIEKPVRDWLTLSAGYLYSWLDGGAAFDQSSRLTDFAALPPAIGFSSFGVFADRFFSSNTILLDQQAHVGSVGFQVGPWQDTVLYGGVQGDWSWQHGFSDVIQRYGSPGAAPINVLSSLDLDRELFEERTGLRFTGLPFTSVYAEGRSQQETINHHGDQFFAGSPVLIRDTDAAARLDEIRTGFNTSPWRGVLLAAHYQVAASQSHYAPTRFDVSPGPLGGGYPNFIAARQTDNDETEVSLTTRLASRLKSTLKYQYERTDYRTTHRSVTNFDFSTNPPTPIEAPPAGTVDAGRQRGHVFSAGLNWSVTSRLNFDVTGSFADTRLETFANGDTSVVPYDGQLWSVQSSATWTLDELTRMNVSYVWSMADYRQDNSAAGLPLGIAYRWHQLRAGVDRQLSPQLSVALLYSFQLYEEPTAAGLNDFTAHGAFVSFTWRWDNPSANATVHPRRF